MAPGLPMFILAVSASLFPLREIVPDTQCSQSTLLSPFVVRHPIWNYMSTCLHVFLLSSLDCKLLKSKDHVCLNSPLQPHCPAQGLTQVQMSRNSAAAVKRILESLENKGVTITCHPDTVSLFPMSTIHLLPMMCRELPNNVTCSF